MDKKRKKIVKIAVLAGTAFFILNAFKKVKAVENIDVNFNSVTIDRTKTNLFNLALLVQWQIDNLSVTDLSFEGIAGKLYMNGSYIGNVNMIPDKAIILKAKQQTIVDSSVNIQTVYAIPEVVRPLLQLIQAGGNIQLKFYFDGQITAGGLPFKFSDTYDYSFTAPSSGTNTGNKTNTGNNTNNTNNTNTNNNANTNSGKDAKSQASSSTTVRGQSITTGRAANLLGFN